MYWPTSIKDIMKWFSFITIIEHSANILKPNKGMISSLLNLFTMFDLYFIDDKDEVEAKSTRGINCKKETGLYLRT